MSDENINTPKRRTHGIADHPLYTIWKKMRQRCTQPWHKSYADYGGRGITVCQRWNASFRDFLTDMGDRPEGGYSLDRIDNDGGYWCGHCEECVALDHPANCKWSTLQEQLNNTRRTRLLTWNGKTQSVSMWARELGIKSWVLFGRLQNGWSDEDALRISVERDGDYKCRKFKRQRGW